MDIHPPGGKLESIRDYLKHLSMVVLGILIALGVDGLREGYRERNLERHSVHAMRAEVEFNHKAVQKALDQCKKVHRTLDRIVTDLERKLRKEPPPAGPDENVDMNVSAPPLASGAWQAALATQAFGHMDYTQTQLWSTTYALQSQVLLLQNEMMHMFDQVGVLSQMSEKSPPDELHAQLTAAADIMGRVSSSEAGWTALLGQYDKALKDSEHD